MTPQRFNEIEAVALELYDDACYDIENTREIYNAIRDCLIALVPHVPVDEPFCEQRCALLSVIAK